MRGGNDHYPWTAADDRNVWNKRFPFLKRFVYTGLLIKWSSNTMDESFEYIVGKQNLLPKNIPFGIFTI